MNILHRKYLPSCILKIKTMFVQNARSLEQLKSSDISQETFSNGKYLVTKDSDLVLLDSQKKAILWKDDSGLRALGSTLQKVILGVSPQGDHCLFAADVTDVPEGGENPSGGYFCQSRKALFLVDGKDADLIAKARGLLHFCRTTKFCKHCAKPLVTQSSGTQKLCPGCQVVHYPTLSPVGIVLVDNQSHDKVLLVRGARHPPGMFSAIAGFVEPGESLEENIRREVAEEVGVELERVEYVSSQHWAMPDSQLMLGCVATTDSDTFEIDTNELESGQWVGADALADAVHRAKKMNRAVGREDTSAQVLWVPPPAAVAHSLMEYWLRKYHDFKPEVTSHI